MKALRRQSAIPPVIGQACGAPPADPSHNSLTGLLHMGILVPDSHNAVNIPQLPNVRTKLQALIYLKRSSRRITRLLGDISYQDDDIRAMCQYALEGGKRARPLLVLLACDAVGGEQSLVLPAAAAIELAHKASCIHDDLVDGDDFRRSVPTFAARFGPEKALAMGDYLISLAYTQLERLAVPAGVAMTCYHLFTHTFRLMTAGQLKDLILTAGRQADLAESLRMLIEKTAAIGELALHVGSLLGGGSAEQICALAGYGRDMGLAFQLMNDLNNFTGLEQGAGRQPATDLIARRQTPLICYAVLTSAPLERARLLDLLQRADPLGPAELQEMRRLVLGAQAPAYISSLIDSLLRQASHRLGSLQPSLARDILGMLTNRAFIARTYF